MKKVKKIINKACIKSKCLTGTGNFVNQYLKLKVAEIQGKGDDFAANYADIWEKYEFDSVSTILKFIDEEISMMKNIESI